MPPAQPGAKTKLCPKCKKRKPLDQFGKHSETRDGLQSHCKECNMMLVKELRERTGYAYSRWYSRVKSRALIRLKDMHPKDFEKLFEEEVTALPAPQYERKNGQTRSRGLSQWDGQP